MPESKDFNLSDYLLLSSPLYNNELWSLKRKLFGQNSLTYAYDQAIRGDSHGGSKLIPLGIAGAIASQGHRLPGMLPGSKFRQILGEFLGKGGLHAIGPKAKPILAGLLSIPITQAIVSGEYTRRSLQDKTASENENSVSSANITASLASLLPQFAATAYFKNLVPKIYSSVDAPLSSKQEDIFNRFLRRKNLIATDPGAILRRGGAPTIGSGPYAGDPFRNFLNNIFKGPSYIPNDDNVLSRIINKIIKSDAGSNANINKTKGFINMPSSFFEELKDSEKVLKPGILAHETGHGLGPSIYTKGLVRRLSALAPLLGAGNIIHTRNEETGRNTALASPLLGAPLLASEFDASMRGSNLLNRLAKGNLNKLQRLAPFVGLPTYAALTLTPAVAHLTKKYMGGYES
jgi:hypothetical protein